MRAALVLRPSALLPVAALLFSSSALAAQEVSACPPAPLAVPAPAGAPDSAQRALGPSLRSAADTGRPDILLFAAVEARTVRFASQPQATIRFCWGEGRGDTLHVVERRNLPTPVVAGTTYRDVYVAAELRANLNAVCLLRELGATAGSDSTAVARGVTSCAALQGRALSPPP